jgi:glyoxylase-like metal-dependent hydrolase (beta-lactamase superfamily II)
MRSAGTVFEWAVVASDMVTQLADGVWWLDLGGVNAYLVDDDGALTLVDTGMPWTKGDLADGIVEAGFTLSALDRILLTHYDLDHVGGLGRFDGLDVTVYAGSGDAALVDGGRSPGWGSHKRALQSLTSLVTASPALDVHPLEDRESIGGFTVVATPGHTDGHVAYVHEGHRAVFAGDLVRESDGSLEPSPWSLSEDVGDVRRSIAALTDRTGEFDVLGMGHGVPFRVRGDERLAELAGALPRAEG